MRVCYSAPVIRLRALLLSLAVLSTAGAPLWPRQVDAPLQKLDDARDLYRAGRLQEALPLFLEVGAALRDSDPANAAAAYNNACAIKLNLGDYDAALALCNSAVALRRTGGDEVRLAAPLNNLGQALAHLGRFAEAAAALEEALAINRRHRSIAGEARNLINLGLNADLAGHYGAALRYYRQAAELAEAHRDQPWAQGRRWRALFNLGVVYERLGAYREALEIYAELLPAANALPPHEHARLLVNAGTLYRNLGDPVRAAEVYERASTIYAAAGDAGGLALAMLNLALVKHHNLGQLSAAESAYRQALELARTAGDRGREMSILVHLGHLLLDGGRYDEARATFEHCLAQAGEGAAAARWSALDGLGRVAAAAGDPAAALERFSRAIELIEAVRAELEEPSLRASYVSDKRAVYGAAVASLHALERRQGGGEHARQALMLVQRAKARELTEALGVGGDELPAAGALVAAVGSDVLVEYFAADRRLFRFVVGGGVVELSDLGPASPVEEAIAEVHRQLAAGRSPPAPTLRALASALLPPRVLARRGRLYLAPDGRLRYLPFELLEVPASSEILLDRQTTIYLPSASSLVRLRHRAEDGWEPGRRLLAYGDPLPPVDDSGTRLPGELLRRRFTLLPLVAASAELEAIAAQLGGSHLIRRREAATESAFRADVAGGARVVHLATHTVVDDGLGVGAAVLLTAAGGDDGLLHPDEIAGLDYRADLTVLAACSTALGSTGDGRGMGSLTGAFLAAGSSAVLATLWDVGDQATAVFMQQLYYELGRGRPPAEALRLAKARLRGDERWQHPGLWSAYVLVGDAPPVKSGRSWWPVALALAPLGLFALGLLWRWRRRIQVLVPDRD